MSLFKRGKLPNGQTYSEENSGGEGLSFLLRDNPLSSHFNPGVGDKPNNKTIVNYMIAIQVKVYGRSIDIPYPALIRNLKLMLEVYSVDLVLRGIKYASLTSNYPYSFKYVKEVIPFIEEQMNGK